MMRENKIVFIVCYNDELYMQECLKYISILEIPDGMETEVIGIQNADSMAAGYNAAMRETDAKFKVYLHQDVFILNKNFIRDVVDIFRKNKDYGMLGVMGSTVQVEDANYWDKWNIGMAYVCDSVWAGIVEKWNPERVTEVTAIDGMIMATQYDIPWREDVFDGFDFYDVSQSMEIRKAGYKIGVPCQKKVWCFHDSGHSKLERYDTYRKRFCREYCDYGYEYRENEEQLLDCIKNRRVEEKLPYIETALECGEFEKAEALVDTAMKFFCFNTKLCMLYYICKIHRGEQLYHIEDGFFHAGMSVQEMIDNMVYYKFFLRRVEFDFPMQELQTELGIIAERKEEALVDCSVIATVSCLNWRETLWKLAWYLQQWEKSCEMIEVTVKEKMDPNNEARKKFLSVEWNLKKVIDKLSGLDENTIYLQHLDKLKEIYNLAISIDEDYKLLSNDEKFHFLYYDVMNTKKNARQFLECYKKWMDDMRENNKINFNNGEGNKGGEVEKCEEPMAYCIVTYNHPDVVEDVLKDIGLVYKQYHIDIYIYDSSSDNRTYWVVKHLVKRGIDNLFYVRIDSSIGIDEKLLMVFKGYKLKKKYKYLWLMKDRAFVQENTLKMLMNEVNKDYDAIFLSTSVEADDVSLVKPVYDDAGEFYNVAGWLATSLNTTIFHYDRLIKDIDWEDFKQRYFFHGENQFDHFTVLFHTLGIKENIQVRFLYGDNVQFCESGIGKSSWINRAFRIWGDLWPKVNEALPTCYDKYKEKVIKQAASLPWILGSWDILLVLKEKGILTAEIYEKLKYMWKYLSSVPIEEFKLIAYSSAQDLKGKGLTFWNILNHLLENGRYQDVCSLYYMYIWLRPFDENGKYTILGECVKIHMMEIQSNVERPIFYGVTDYEYVIQKYMLMKYMLKRIEYGVATENWNDIVKYVQENRISHQFIMYIVNKHCLNQKLILERFVDLFENMGTNNE